MVTEIGIDLTGRITIRIDRAAIRMPTRMVHTVTMPRGTTVIVTRTIIGIIAITTSRGIPSSTDRNIRDTHIGITTFQIETETEIKGKEIQSGPKWTALNNMTLRPGVV